MQVRVQAAGLMGQEAYVYTKLDAKMADTQILKYGKKILRGRACHKAIKEAKERGNDVAVTGDTLTTIYKAMPVQDIWKKIKMVPSMLELGDECKLCSRFDPTECACGGTTIEPDLSEIETDHFARINLEILKNE